MCSRDAIEDIWGPRTGYYEVWPSRVDFNVTEEPEKWVQSACVMCSNGCGLDIGVKNGKIVGVRGREVDRVNKGRLGPKGLHSWAANGSKDRLTTPLIRMKGKLVPATWDEAMNLVVDRVKLASKNSKHSIGFYTSGQLFLEEYYALAVIGKAGLNTLHMDGNTRLCTATAAAALRESFGSDGQPGSFADLDLTDCILLVGHNMAATETVLWSRILDRLHGPRPPTLIVIDPRETPTAKMATYHLAPAVGTNVAVLNGIQRLLLPYCDEEFIATCTIGFEELKSTVSKYTPEYVEEISKVPADLLRKAADAIGNSLSLVSTVLQGVYQSNQATASACQVNNINLILGRIGKPGSGVLQMNGQPTAQNNRETGCNGEFPGFRNHLNQQVCPPITLSNWEHMQNLADIWNVELVRLPHWGQPTHVMSMLNYIEAGSISVFWISATNPLVSLPDSNRVRKLLTKEELFVIVQDIFMTETAEIADVVLPAAAWGEKTGCFTNADRTVHISHKAIDPPGVAKSDFDIFVEFAQKMGFRDKNGMSLIPWKNPEEAFKAWQRCSAGRPCDYTGLSYAKLSEASGIQWPCNEDYPNGRERLYSDKLFYTDIDACETYGHDLETGAPLTRDQYGAMNPAGRAILKSANYRPPEEMVDEKYPFTLSTGRNVFHFHTRTKTGRVPQLQRAQPEPVVEISKADAERIGISEGRMVIVSSRRGKVQLPAKIGKISPGQVFIPFHYGYWDSDIARAANELTSDSWDLISKQPMFKFGAVNIQAAATTLHHLPPKVIHKAPPPLARDRKLERYLQDLSDNIKLLSAIYSDFRDGEADYEMREGMSILQDITSEIQSRLQRTYTKYGIRINDNVGEPPPKSSVIDNLLHLLFQLAKIEGLLVLLTTSSAALWDEDFVEGIGYSTKQLHRQIAWVRNVLKIRGPQALIVPTT